MPGFEHQGCRLVWREESVAGGVDPVLLVAGFNGTGDFWQPVVDAWHEAAVPARLLLPDYRGAGASGRWSAGDAGLPVQMLADDMLAVLAHAGISRAHVIGHSYGSVIAQVMAARSPQAMASLTLSATFARVDTALRRWFELRLQVLRECGPQAFVELGSLLSHPPEWLRANWEDLRAREARQLAALREPGAQQAVLARAKGLMAVDTGDLLPRIRAATLVMAARDDTLTAPGLSREVARRIPAATFVQFDEGGHSFVRTHPRQYLARWLEHHGQTLARSMSA